MVGPTPLQRFDKLAVMWSFMLPPDDVFDCCFSPKFSSDVALSSSVPANLAGFKVARPDGLNEMLTT